MLSQVTKQNDENRTLPFPQIKSIEYYLNFFSRKSFRSFLFTHTKFVFCKLNQIYKNHHQNTLHAWGDIKILLLEMKVQLGNVALNIWKWHFLTQLLLIKTWLYEYRKVLKLATTKLKWTLLGDNITDLAFLARNYAIKIYLKIVIKFFFHKF